MLRRILLAGLCVAATAVAGCGTLHNQGGTDLYITGAWSPPSKPYGGVERDWDAIAEGCDRHRLAEERPDAWAVAFMLAIPIIDLPLSAAGDTVMLPYDAAVTLARHREPAEANKTPPDPAK